MKEAERLQFELFTIKRRYNIPDTTANGSANMKEFNRLWQKVQEVEDEMRRAERTPFSDVSNLQNQQAGGAGAGAKAVLLERQLSAQGTELDDSRAAIRKYRDEIEHVRTSSHKEITTLQRALATHKKDREAMKTIMETQIQVRIGTIATLLHSVSNPNAGADVRARLEKEVCVRVAFFFFFRK